jgi:SAM-dependent methyltransferase
MPTPGPYTATTFEAKVRRVWHLDHLRAVSCILGHRWGDDKPRRVLSVGCGTGVHLVPLACQYPEVHFIGCDPEVEPLSRGISYRDFCGCRNLDFVTGTIDAIEAANNEATFDVILVQGVYSWIEEGARDSLLGGVVARLSEEGVLLLTHNIAPGWTIRQVVQQFLGSIGIVPSDLISDEAVRMARTQLERFREEINRDSVYGSLVWGEVTRILSESTAYLRHEFLNPATSAGPLCELVRRAQTVGLSYLGDARFSRNPFPGLRDSVGRGSDGNRGDAATFRDFCRGLPYRESLFTRRSLSSPFPRVTEESLSSLSFGCALVEDEDSPGYFRDPAGREFSFRADELDGEIVRLLAAHWPRCLSWLDLRQGIDGKDGITEKGSQLAYCLTSLLASEFITCASRPPVFKDTTEIVTAPQWLGWEMTAGGVLTNRWYEPVELGGFELMLLSGIVGGLHSVEGLISLTRMQISQSPDHRTLPAEVVSETVKDGLFTLARAGLLHEIVLR